ncbi:Ldh family oxidoreductase [Candidatus Poribacteria bacterium]|nr:Ldh family oxidoreductase [Candidatus Poribacteria bacterium]MYI93234.1 Ldh family oxidoreductase [Candidatus Poribacteria bacterium]
MTKTHLFHAPHIHAIARTLFVAAGTSNHIADDVAEILVKAHLTGHDSHGVLRIPAYLSAIESGGIKPTAEPAVVAETDNTLRVDGNQCFGHYVSRWTIRKSIEKSKQSGMCCVSIFNTGHIGRLGEYAEEAAAAGCIGLITVGKGGKGAGPMVPYGGSQGTFSTNPIAIGVPTGDAAPFIVDYATSVIAEGKIQVARSKDADLPEGCILDKNGVPSIKPADFYDGGTLLTFGRHKGYALAMFTCLLGGLAGTFNVETGNMGGIYMQTIDVNAFTPINEYQKGVRAFLDVIKATPPAQGFDEVLSPGDFEARNRAERLKNGIEIPDTIYKQLLACAEKRNVSIGDDIITTEDKRHYETT